MVFAVAIHTNYHFILGYGCPEELLGSHGGYLYGINRLRRRACWYQVPYNASIMWRCSDATFMDSPTCLDRFMDRHMGCNSLKLDLPVSVIAATETVLALGWLAIRPPGIYSRMYLKITRAIKWVLNYTTGTQVRNLRPLVNNIQLNDWLINNFDKKLIILYSSLCFRLESAGRG